MTPSPLRKATSRSKAPNLSQHRPRSFETREPFFRLPLNDFRGDKCGERNHDGDDRQTHGTFIAARHLRIGVDRRRDRLRLAGIFETNVIVAPNSPSAFAKARIAPTTMPGIASGRLTRKNVQMRFAPRVPAVSSRRRSIDSKDRRIARTMSGKPITAQATAAPVQRKDKTMPMSARKGPKTPLRPNRMTA